MSNETAATDPTRSSRLNYSREFFADYLTALESRIRQSVDADDIFTCATPYPLVELQVLNRAQILDLQIRLIAPDYLVHHPIVPTERFIVLVKAKSTATGYAKAHTQMGRFLGRLAEIQGRPAANLQHHRFYAPSRHFGTLRACGAFRSRHVPVQRYPKRKYAKHN